MKQSSLDVNKIALIGAPSSAGARQVGQEQAPECLRNAGLVQCLQSDGHEVLDLGDLAQVSFTPDPQHPRQQNISLVVSVLEQVAGRVDSAVTDRAWPLVVGGDCTVTIGVLAALTIHFPSLGLMYLDGDVDLNTPETTFTGILDGMVLAHILGRGADELSRFGSRYPMLEERNITLFGYSAQAGGIDPVEMELLEDTRMAKYPLEVVKGAVRDTATRALRDLENKVEHILVHFDVDVVDAHDFPAVDVPHNPGLGLLQVQEALRIFLGSRKSVGLVVTEFNAGRDSDGRLAAQLIEMFREARGKGGHS